MKTTSKLCACAFSVALYVSSIGIATAQTATAGNTGVYNQSTTSAPVSFSPAYIDASAISYYENSLGQAVDFCKTINNILTSASGYPTYPAQGAVIDARGILNIPVLQSNGKYVTSPLQCGSNPFASLTAPTRATILLPGATISAKVPWVIPSETKIVGEGRNATTIGLEQNFL